VELSGRGGNTDSGMSTVCGWGVDRKRKREERGEGKKRKEHEEEITVSFQIGEECVYEKKACPQM
jgi:hypothetical protein